MTDDRAGFANNGMLGTGLARLMTMAVLLAMPLPALAAQNKPSEPQNAKAEASQPEAAQDDENRPTIGNAADKVGNTVERIVERPLKDFNIMKTKAKPDLEAVMDDPYSLKGLRTCRQYRAEVAKMTRSLGPDVDAPAAADKSKADSRAEFALGAGEAVANTFIPGGGLIRRISGAEKRQKYALAAVYAGTVRRSYIKGLMLGKKCHR